MSEPDGGAVLRDLLAHAKNSVEAVEGGDADELALLGITTASLLGGLTAYFGAVVIDHGWLRLLGGGSREVNGLTWWNGVGEEANPEPLEQAFIVAHDAVGGFFALDGGAFDTADGATWYLAPDTLRWEPLKMPHSQFVRWALDGDVAHFYESLRWPGWEAEIGALNPNTGLHLFPPPWVREGKDIGAVSRKPISMAELWRLQGEMRRQLDGA